MTKKPLVHIENLDVEFPLGRKLFGKIPMLKAVNGVSRDIMPRQFYGLVGESGSGKSVTSLSINRLIPNPPGEIVNGEIIYNGVNLLGLSYEEMRDYRGKHISMIFQEPMTSLNPVLRVATQMNEILMEHEGLTSD